MLNPYSKLRIATLHKKALKIINNQLRNSDSGLLFKKSNILKFDNTILIYIIIFITKLLIFYHQSSKIGLSCALRFKTMTVSLSTYKLFLSLRLEIRLRLNPHLTFSNIS